jgi:hypothetical protein
MYFGSGLAYFGSGLANFGGGLAPQFLSDSLDILRVCRYHMSGSVCQFPCETV